MENFLIIVTIFKNFSKFIDNCRNECEPDNRKPIISCNYLKMENFAQERRKHKNNLKRNSDKCCQKKDFICKKFFRNNRMIFTTNRKRKEHLRKNKCNKCHCLRIFKLII